MQHVIWQMFQFQQQILLITCLLWAATNKTQVWKWLLCKAIALGMRDLKTCHKDLPNTSYQVEILDWNNPQMPEGVLKKKYWALWRLSLWWGIDLGNTSLFSELFFHWSQWADIEKGKHYFEPSKDFLKLWLCISLAQGIKTHYWCYLLLKLYF